MFQAIGKRLRALHRDEQGADMVEYILIVAAIGLPLLAVIIYFWKDVIQPAVAGMLDSILGEAEDTVENPGG